MSDKKYPDDGYGVAFGDPFPLWGACIFLVEALVLVALIARYGTG